MKRTAKRIKEPREEPEKHLLKLKFPSWDKIMMVVIIAICVEIVAYSEVAMWIKDDLSAMYELISIPLALFGVFWAYAEKAKKQNSEGGITYEMAMKGLENRESERAPEDAEG